MTIRCFVSPSGSGARFAKALFVSVRSEFPAARQLTRSLDSTVSSRTLLSFRIFPCVTPRRLFSLRVSKGNLLVAIAELSSRLDPAPSGHRRDLDQFNYTIPFSCSTLAFPGSHAPLVSSRTHCFPASRTSSVDGVR